MTAPAAEFDPDAAQLRFDLPGMGTASAIKPPKKVLLHEDVGLPLRVHWHVGGELFSLLIVEPDWLDAPNQPRDLGELLGRSGKDPYTACSVIVMRRSDSAGEEQVLLCKRRMGAGVGTFALPGGKKNEGESIRACAARELKEEVGLRFRDGRPISINVTEEPGFPRVTSIGIVATAWDGEPRNREHLAHTRWEWFSLNKLPRPLFFPTELVLSDFILNRFPDLSWEKVGEDMSLPLWENQGRPKWTR